MYNLNPNSLTSRFYNWLWDTDVTKFKNMCPYFWNYVFTILVLPVMLPLKIIIAILSFITPQSKTMVKLGSTMVNSKPIKGIGNAFNWVATRDTFWYYVNKICKWTIVIGLISILGGSLIYLIITDHHVFFECIGITVVILSALGGFVYFTDKFSVLSKLWYPFKLCGNMVYNLYKGLCPMLTWDK